MNILKSIWLFLTTLADGITRHGYDVSPVDESNTWKRHKNR